MVEQTGKQSAKLLHNIAAIVSLHKQISTFQNIMYIPYEYKVFSNSYNMFLLLGI